MSMISSQNLNLRISQIHKNLENERSFFLEMKKFIDYSSRTTLWQEITTPFIAFKIFFLDMQFKI